ncbi:MAG: hypothetical protein IPN17_05430 [Deltaproteobacteria bacterium]|nr:hypothetical protein [Deltaproteobacteria bacterium]
MVGSHRVDGEQHEARRLLRGLWRQRDQVPGALLGLQPGVAAGAVLVAAVAGDVVGAGETRASRSLQSPPLKTAE